MKRNGNQTTKHGTALLDAARSSSGDLPARAETSLPPPAGVIVGILKGIDTNGFPLVGFPARGTAPPLVAKHVCAISVEDVGKETVLSFEGGDLRRPVILGLVKGPIAPVKVPPQAEISLDGERLVFTAKEEIVLRCGKASITLTRAGKVLIRGAYLLSRSSGVNRIKGGSVQIN